MGRIEELDQSQRSRADSRETDTAAVKGFRAEVATLTASRVGIEAKLFDAENRCGVEEARALKLEAESASAVGRTQRNWALNQDAKDKRLRGKFAVTCTEDRAASSLETGEVSTDALHKVDEAAHEARTEKQELSKAHWMVVRDLEVKTVRVQSVTKVSRRFV